MTEPLTIYDIATDSRRPVTQTDILQMEERLWALAFCPVPEPTEPITIGTMPVRLAVFPNRMRPGRAFVAEEKEISPYPGMAGLNDQPLFPSVPDSQFVIQTDIDVDWARELVRRWNSA